MTRDEHSRIVDLSAAKWDFRPGKQITCSVARWLSQEGREIRTPLLDCETDEETGFVVDGRTIGLYGYHSGTVGLSVEPWTDAFVFGREDRAHTDIYFEGMACTSVPEWRTRRSFDLVTSFGVGINRESTSR
jgi:hypothetical protein